jgi:hypothetical protein
MIADRLYDRSSGNLFIEMIKGKVEPIKIRKCYKIQLQSYIIHTFGNFWNKLEKGQYLVSGMEFNAAITCFHATTSV